VDAREDTVHPGFASLNPGLRGAAKRGAGTRRRRHDLRNSRLEETMNSMTETQHLSDTVTLSADERQRCEVWTRVMGYHRPVASFNIGKKGEHVERRFFVEASASRQS
jgi:hypothetical protein